MTVAINYQNIKKEHQKMSKIKLFINQYKWKNKHFPPSQKDWEKFEKNNTTTALNILYVPYNTEEISIAYKSEYNNDHKNQLILLMINDNEKWHYLALKNEDRSDGEKYCSCPVASLKRLLRVMTSKHHGNFYCLNCLYCSYSAKDRLKKQEELCNKYNYCHIEMPKKYNNILKYNDGKMSLKSPFVIELDIECILEK